MLSSRNSCKAAWCRAKLPTLISPFATQKASLTLSPQLRHTLDNSWSHKTQIKWPVDYPISARGRRQSPIDIRLSDVTKKDLEPFKLELVAGSASEYWTLSNNGHTIMVTPPCGVKWQLSGSMLEGKYILDHFHSHWGKSCGYGCEHLLDGEKFEGETHFVFKWAPGQNHECEDVAAVWGVFMKEADQTNPKAKMIIDDIIGSNLEKISDPLSGAISIPAVDFADLVPMGLSNYFAYKGSLTTPPFTEAVLHIVYEKPLEISKQVFDKLRNLHDLNHEKLEINYRSIQPLLGREIVSSS